MLLKDQPSKQMTSHVIASESSFIMQDAYWEICKMTEVNNLFGNLILVM